MSYLSVCITYNLVAVDNKCRFLFQSVHTVCQLSLSISLGRGTGGTFTLLQLLSKLPHCHTVKSVAQSKVSLCQKSLEDIEDQRHHNHYHSDREDLEDHIELWLLSHLSLNFWRDKETRHVWVEQQSYCTAWRSKADAVKLMKLNHTLQGSMQIIKLPLLLL